MIHISLGSNIGHRLKYLQDAVKLLKDTYLKNMRYSIVLETECILPENAPPDWNMNFLNMVVAGESHLSPDQLLQGLKKIECILGRPEVYEKWAPRVIDLDILSWDDHTYDTPHLKIPHPELENRPFLLHLLAMMGTSYKKIQLQKNCFLKSFALFPRFVGVVNITPDSFSDGGLFDDPQKAISHAMRLSEDGAYLIEIGAQSTRLGATLQPPEEEYAKLEPILDALNPLMAKGAMMISVDTFWPSVIHKILKKYPISWINDQRGHLDDQTLRLIADRNCSICIMHSLVIPHKHDIILSHDKPPMTVIMDWAKKTKDHLLRLGFKDETIIIDPGIGFGKSAYQNIEILRNFEKLKTLDSPLLIGHSRKSYMETFSKEEAKNRDLETIGISSSLEHRADFLRVHNIADHMRFFVARQALECGVS